MCQGGKKSLSRIKNSAPQRFFDCAQDFATRLTRRVDGSRSFDGAAASRCEAVLPPLASQQDRPPTGGSTGGVPPTLAQRTR